MRLLLILLFGLTTGFASDKTQVFFSPHGGCTEAIVGELNQAKKSILVQAYSFTSAPIAKAVVDAHKRGVIDRERVITGSFNFTKQPGDAENLLLIRDVSVAGRRIARG